MRRATIFLGLTCTAIALVIVAVVHGIGFDQPASNSEQAHGQLEDASELSKSSFVVRHGSDSEQKRSNQEDSQNSTPSRKFRPEDEATTRREVKELATRYVQDVYSLLIRDFDLTSSQNDALMSLLIEGEIAATRTFYSSGEGMDELERSNRIAAIIGEQELQEFLALERSREEYEEIAKVQSMLKKRDTPLTDAQLDGLLEKMVEVRQQLGRNQPAGDISPVEFVEYRIDQEDEFDRLVLELAPSVLSATQVDYLFELYQAQSYQRAHILEVQKRAISRDPTKSKYVGYPSRN